MCNLGLHSVYGLINERPDCLCERFFWEPRSRSQRSLDSGRPLNSFDVLAFSVSYELDFLRVIKVLDLAGLRNDGSRRQIMPLIIAGGMANTINQSALSEYADLIFKGDAEESLAEFLDLMGKSASLNTRDRKDSLLEQAARIAGVFVPGHSASADVRPRVLKDVDRYPSFSRIITPDTEFSDTFLVELARGCVWSCNFCSTGSLFHDFRPRSFDVLAETIESGLRYTNKIGLVSAAISDYPRLSQLLDFLRLRKARISISSLRVETTRAPLLSALAESGQRTVTFAPEAGSPEFRKTLNKNIGDEQIIEKIRLAKKCGIKKIKLYFMIGLPGERTADIEAIAGLAKRAAEFLPVKLNISVLVPKPYTKFASAEMETKPQVLKKIKIIKKLISGSKKITLNPPAVKEAYLESRLCRIEGNFFRDYRS